MPIRRSSLGMDILLKDQQSYDIVSKKIKELNMPYAMRDVVGSTFGESVLPPFEIDKLIANCEDVFALLDRYKPLYGSDEPGMHYANELFFVRPPYWGSRGAPFMWVYCARAFTMDSIPMNPASLEKKYFNCFLELGIPIHGDDYVFVEQFAWSGMSGGRVGGDFGIDTLQVLIERHEQLSKLSLSNQ